MVGFDMEGKNCHHICHPFGNMQNWHVLSSSVNGTRLYINGLCVTATENLKGFISIEEI